MTFLERSHYDIPKSSIGRHLLVSSLDFNNGRQNGYGGNWDFDTLAQHSVSGFDFNFEGLMIYVGNAYRGMASSSTDEQFARDFGCIYNYTIRDNVLLTTSIEEGISNPKHAMGVEIEEGIKSCWSPICPGPTLKPKQNKF